MVAKRSQATAVEALTHAPGRDEESQASNALSGGLGGEGEVFLPLKSTLCPM